MSNAQLNLRLLLWIQAMNGAFFLMPVIVLFYLASDLTLANVFVLQGIYAASIILLEVPSGHLSDRWGRRPTIITGCIFTFIAMSVFSIGNSFWVFAVAEIFLAIGTSLHSGTIEAFTYENLEDLGQESDFRKVIGRQSSYHYTAEAAASIAGGLIAGLAFEYAIRLTAVASMVPLAVGVILAVLLKALPTHERFNEKPPSLGRIVNRVLSQRNLVQSAILVHGALGGTALIMFWFLQPYQLSVDLPVEWFGVTFAVITLCGGLGARYAHVLALYVHDATALKLIAAVLILGPLIASFQFGLAGLLLFLMVRIATGFLGPLTSNIINEGTPQNQRATVLSLRELTTRLVFVITGPLLGRVADSQGLSVALFVTGILASLLSIGVFAWGRRHWK